MTSNSPDPIGGRNPPPQEKKLTIFVTSGNMAFHDRRTLDPSSRCKVSCCAILPRSHPKTLAAKTDARGGKWSANPGPIFWTGRIAEVAVTGEGSVFGTLRKFSTGQGGYRSFCSASTTSPQNNGGSRAGSARTSAAPGRECRGGRGHGKNPACRKDSGGTGFSADDIPAGSS